MAANGVIRAAEDSDDDDADMDLLLDWRGKGSKTAGLVQQTLGFKQVKRRSLDAVKTTIPNVPSVLGRDEKRGDEVNRNFENVVLVSLSDDEDDPRPIRRRRKDAKPVSTSVKHADVVYLDSDSEPDLCPSVDLKGEGSTTFGKEVVRRSCTNASFSEEVRTGSGPSKHIAMSKGGESRREPSPAELEESSNKTLEFSNLDNVSPSSQSTASLNENTVGVRTSEMYASQDANAGSSGRDDTTEIEFISSEERVLNFKKILEGRGAHEDSIARPLRREGNASERGTELSVYDIKYVTVSESGAVSKSSPPGLGPAFRKCSNIVCASTSVTSTKNSLSTARESQENLNLPSNIVIEDLTTSDNEDESGNPCWSRSSKSDGALSRRFQIGDFDFGGNRTFDTKSQDSLRPEKLNRVAGVSIEDLSADEGSESGRLHAVKDTGGSRGGERNDITNVPTSFTGLAPGIRSSKVPPCDLDTTDDENIFTQLPLKKKCIRSRDDPILEERSANAETGEFDSETTNLPVMGAKGRKCLSSEKASSAFESTKSFIELEKSEKQRERERKQETRKTLKEEEKKRRQEEARQKKEELRQQKEEAKAEAAERKKIEQERFKWKKGKFALQNTTVYIDKRIIESKNLGPPLLQHLASKEYTYQVVTNRVEKTILWTMKMPPEDSQAILDARESQDEPISYSQLPLEEVEIKYVVVFLDAAEFSDMVAGDLVNSHISRIKKEHSGYTIDYLVNNLTRYIDKKEQNQYRTGDRSWKRPKVERVLAEFITHQVAVRSRLCIDENEMAEHIVSLTRSLAECPFKPKLTSLTINANGEHIAKNDPHREVIKRDPWKKALAAIPNITGAAVIAITKVYPTMRALLNAYLDPSKTVLEKEFILQDIVKDAAIGSARAEGRRVGPVCSKRIYRLLMAQNCNLRTEAAEEGEDYFRN